MSEFSERTTYAPHPYEALFTLENIFLEVLKMFNIFSKIQMEMGLLICRNGDFWSPEIALPVTAFTVTGLARARSVIHELWLLLRAKQIPHLAL